MRSRNGASPSFNLLHLSVLIALSTLPLDLLAIVGCYDCFSWDHVHCLDYYNIYLFLFHFIPSSGSTFIFFSKLTVKSLTYNVERRSNSDLLRMQAILHRLKLHLCSQGNRNGVYLNSSSWRLCSIRLITFFKKNTFNLFVIVFQNAE